MALFSSGYAIINSLKKAMVTVFIMTGTSWILHLFSFELNNKRLSLWHQTNSTRIQQARHSVVLIAVCRIVTGRRRNILISV